MTSIIPPSRNEILSVAKDLNYKNLRKLTDQDRKVLNLVIARKSV